MCWTKTTSKIIHLFNKLKDVLVCKYFSLFFFTVNIFAAAFPLQKFCHWKIKQLVDPFWFDSFLSTDWNALAYLPVTDITDSYIELTDEDDLPQELVSYFEHTTLGEKKPRSIGELTSPSELWNVCWGGVTIWEEINKNIEVFTMQHKVQLQIWIWVCGKWYLS